ncbi:HAD family hydrolase [Algoriphagus hitonicola]|uniref:Haloacid dehalogenase superfamily, subfamily IA, variant 3 with third motif having DD or ED n=1 Tax=Algoriphagus hitonicola TaxID=435880 RepID=A0A1I2VC27_9BACT|nr:HAD family phosphatase [Algoriphagus hitonicola]SFG86914.1 haloacid dehalogenase superfamily, subfamily IA, variant 3 with third motif having DD or ED [Algoriphagus hitonicola]
MSKAILFDMDGVICHTNPFHSLAFKEFFLKRDMFPTEEEFSLHMYGKSNSYIMSHFFKRKIEGKELLLLENEKESLFREIYQHHVDPISGFLEFLEKIKARGLKTAVATSAPMANLELIAGKLNLFPHFESAMASEHVTKHKPDPEVYLKSAEKLNVHPADCIVFEDSFSGATAGLNAGMKVVAVLSSHTQEELPACHHYIEDYQGLDPDVLFEILDIR